MRSGSGIDPDPLKEMAMLSVSESVDRNHSTQAPTLELGDIQATVLRPRPAPYFGTHVLLRIDDAKAGREFLSRITPYVASSTEWWNDKNTWLAVAITYSGLEALGVPEESLQS